MSKLKFGPITEKMECVEVMGQDTDAACLLDCKRTIWFGNNSAVQNCRKGTYPDAYKSVSL